MSAANAVSKKVKAPKNSLTGKKKDNILKRFWKTRFLFALFLPALVHYIMFKYVPMWGIRMAWYKYSIFGGWPMSKFVGWQNFEIFFNNPIWYKYTLNTFALGFQSVFISFPLTVFFALMLNEIRSLKFKKVTQTISYMPHFLSTVVVVALMRSLCDPVNGGINQIISALGGEPIHFFVEGKWFRPLYLISGIWQGLGWGTIVFLAAIAGVDPGLYEAARLDGAGRWRQMWNITIPTIMPTITTMFIMQIGHILGDSTEKVLLMQEMVTYDYSMTLSTYVFNAGLSRGDYGGSTAVNLCTNLVNLTFVLGANWLSKKVTDSGIF